MKSISRVALAASTLALPLIAAGPAEASTPAPTNFIVGGQPASHPGIVQLEFGQDGKTYGCTGELINSEWVLTAQHCTDGDDWMNVYISNDTHRRGSAHKADRWENSPAGDVALVHLAKPVANSNTLPLADSYEPQAGAQGTIFGYGLRANRVPTDGLFSARVNVLGASSDAYGGRAIHIKGDSGASNHGDSGGPLIIDGEVVGVCSTGDTSDPGADTQAGSNYANLTDSGEWIRETSGV